jgi:hypothetical protein
MTVIGMAGLRMAEVGPWRVDLATGSLGRVLLITDGLGQPGV